MKMKSEEALKKIDNLVNVLSIDIPEKIEVFGEIYYPKKEIEEPSERTLLKYEALYDSLRDEIKRMEDVPEDIVEKAIVLRRIVLFLKEYGHTDEMEDKKRWIKFVRKMS